MLLDAIVPPSPAARSQLLAGLVMTFGRPQVRGKLTPLGPSSSLRRVCMDPGREQHAWPGPRRRGMAGTG